MTVNCQARIKLIDFLIELNFLMRIFQLLLMDKNVINGRLKNGISP